MAEIALDRITKQFPNGFRAVSDLSLEVADGEFLVLVGPSGCGKTTALRMVAGLETITSGDVYVGGRRVNDVLEKDRDMAMVFQNYALYPHMTVAQNIGFNLKLSGVPRHEIHERVRKTAELLGLERLLARRPKQLSGGQRQRVAMGRAIIRDPHAFLMDEPLSNLDAKLRVQMRSEIAALQKRLGTTTLYVTHDQVEAMTMGDRVAVLKDGELQQVATPAEIYDRPANLFVAGFIGSPPMNLVHGRIRQAGDGLVVEAGSLTIPVPDDVARERGVGGWLDRELFLGIRPEDLRHAEGDGEAAVHFPATVTRVEAIGASLLVYFATDTQAVKAKSVAPGGEHLVEAPLIGGEGGATLCASFEPRSFVRPGDRVEIAVDPRRIHLFDPESEIAIDATPMAGVAG